MKIAARWAAMISVTASLVLAACSQPTDETAQETSRIEITDYWLRPIFTENGNTTGYMAIENKGDTDDRLLSAAADGAMRTELHITEMHGDQMQMSSVDAGVPIPAGASIKLAPAGTHIMIMGVSRKLDEGDSLPLTLTFEKAGEIKLDMPVRTSVGQ